MAEEFYSLVTDYGAEKQLRCITDGLPFEVTHIALGDGNGRYYEPSTLQTKLVNEVWRGNVEKCEWIENRFYCVTTVPAEIGGFEVREAGVFDAENNLLVITKFPETTKQAEDEFRIPDYNVTKRFLQPSNDVAQKINAGLPNITATWTPKWGWIDGVSCSGAITAININRASGSGGGGGNPWGINFNASRSSSIYGNSTTVQPPAHTVHLCIKYK